MRIMNYHLVFPSLTTTTVERHQMTLEQVQPCIGVYLSIYL
jgi:hypothetical protein